MEIVSFSGGKDSTAMLLMMLEKNVHIDKIVFADTTFEYPEMYDWIDTIEKLIGRPITKLMPRVNFYDWFYGTFTRGRLKGRVRGFPYVVNPCYWNREAKYLPLEKAHGVGNTIFIGIAYDERKRTERKQYTKFNNEYRFPLVEWKMTEDDCINYLINKGLDHPLIKFKRTGCWLCPKQSIGSLRILYEDYPNLWAELKRLEMDSPHGFRVKGTLTELERRFDDEKR
jgi:3'-phosphoadenosine 5'-phosphosulfate sulfotransferase (PAPS reductase)/FAD synthetase